MKKLLEKSVGLLLWPTVALIIVANVIADMIFSPSELEDEEEETGE